MMKKTILRFDSWRHPVMAEILGDGTIELVQADQGNVAQASSEFARAHVYQISSTRDELPPHCLVTTELLRRCPQLLCVSTSGAGFDTVDVAACTQAGVLVVNQAGGNAAAVAEHTLGMMIALSRRLLETDRRLRSERGFARQELMGHDIGGKTLGLVGIGHVGSRVTALARAFGMTVLACDPYLTEATIRERGVEPRSLQALLSEADFVSLHCPRTAETTGMMNSDAFGRMKQGSFFLTTARGGIHDEPALVEALASGQIAGAGIDVWDREPPPLDHPLLKLPNVLASYHLAGVTHEARRNMAVMAAEQIRVVLDGRVPPRLVNPEAWKSYAARFEAILGMPVKGAALS